MKNENVVKAWQSGKIARNGNGSLHCNAAGDLFSYSLKIGRRSPDGRTIIADYTANTANYHSQTTSSHVNLARRYADECMNPVVWNSLGSVWTSPGVPARIKMKMR